MGIEVADNGRGTAPHLASALLGLQSGSQFLEVHYPGGAQAMQATLGGADQDDGRNLQRCRRQCAGRQDARAGVDG